MAVTAPQPALALESDAPPQPSATGVFVRQQPSWLANTNPWMLIVVLFFGGGGSGLIGAGIARGDDTAGAKAVSRVEAVETRMEKFSERLSGIEAEQRSSESARAEQTRYLRWMARTLEAQSSAIRDIAAANGVTVDLSVTPLMP